jgi:hypothetical protein
MGGGKGIDRRIVVAESDSVEEDQQDVRHRGFTTEGTEATEKR